MEEQEVALTFLAPDARVVQVAGTFNGWRPESNPLERTESGEWTTRLVLRSGRYEYRFVADGAWTEDPRSAQNTVNPFGGLNSILKVRLDDRTEFL